MASFNISLTKAAARHIGITAECNCSPQQHARNLLERCSQFVALEIENLNLDPLNQRAHLANAAIDHKASAGAASVRAEVVRPHARGGAAAVRTIKADHPVLALRLKAVAQQLPKRHYAGAMRIDLI